MWKDEFLFIIYLLGKRDLITENDLSKNLAENLIEETVEYKET